MIYSSHTTSHNIGRACAERREAFEVGVGMGMKSPPSVRTDNNLYVLPLVDTPGPVSLRG